MSSFYSDKTHKLNPFTRNFLTEPNQDKCKDLTCPLFRTHQVLVINRCDVCYGSKTTLPGMVVLPLKSIASAASAKGKVRFTNTLNFPLSTISANFAIISELGWAPNP